jgi:hypothetical protein
MATGPERAIFVKMPAIMLLRSLAEEDEQPCDSLTNYRRDYRSICWHRLTLGQDTLRIDQWCIGLIKVTPP